MDWDLLSHIGFVEHLASYVALRDLGALMAVSRLFRSTVDTPRVYRIALARWAAARRDALPELVCFLRSASFEGRFADLSDAQLLQLSTAVSRAHGPRYAAPSPQRDALLASLAKWEGDWGGQGREWRARSALRLALCDARRTRLHAEELCSLEWHHRIRADGPLAELAGIDPWWAGQQCGTRVKFKLDGTFEYVFAANSPMAFLRERLQQLRFETRYTLAERHGVCILDLQPFGVSGIPARHPKHGGWILVLPASVWTSWPSLRGQEPTLEDDVVDDLISHVFPTRDDPEAFRAPLPYTSGIYGLPPHRQHGGQ